MQSLVHNQLSKFGNIYMLVISISKSFIPPILKVVSPFRKYLIYFSPLGFVLQKNYDSETSEFKLHSFRAFRQYLTGKSQRLVEEQHQFFNLVHVVFERTLDSLLSVNV